MNDQILQIIIQAKDTASAVMKQVGGAIDGMDDKVKKASQSMKEFGQKGTLFVSVPLLALGGYFIKTAMDAEEMENRFLATFRGLEKEAINFTNTFSQAVGRSVVDTQKGLSSFQGIALGLGMAKEEAFNFSTQLQTLAVDFGSFNNLSDQESISRFIAAISGSPEVLDQFGVNIREANLELQLQKMGIKENVQQATEMQKALARLNIIKEVMGSQGALGDAVKTADSAANQSRRTTAEFNQLSADLGSKLLPIFIEVLKFLNSIISAFSNLDPQLQNGILLFGGLLIVIFPIISILGTLGLALSGIVTIAGILGVSVLALSGGFLVIIGVIMLLVGAGIYLYQNWDRILNGMQSTAIRSKDAIIGAFNSIKDSVSNSISSTWNGVINDFRNKLNGFRNMINPIIYKIRSIPGVPWINEIPGFANGGIVGGNSMSGDKILARVNSGELILNRSQQDRLASQLTNNNTVNNTPTINININGYNQDPRSLVDTIMREINKQTQMSSLGLNPAY